MASEYDAVPLVLVLLGQIKFAPVERFRVRDSGVVLRDGSKLVQRFME